MMTSRKGYRLGKRCAIINDPTHAPSPADANNRLEYMKAIVQTANVEEETISLKELVPFWFAVSSPLVGMLLGLLGAWFVTWLSV
jgi:hypothetical protein